MNSICNFLYRSSDTYETKQQIQILTAFCCHPAMASLRVFSTATDHAAAVLKTDGLWHCF